MKSSSLFDSIVKTAKKNYKLILIILLLITVIILIFVFNPYDNNIEQFANPEIPLSSVDVSSGKEVSIVTTNIPKFYGRYIDYTVISPQNINSTPVDSITTITYKLPSVLHVVSIGFNNDNGDNILAGDISVDLFMINTNNSTELIGDIGVDENLSPPVSDITINKTDIKNSYTPIIRKARTTTNNVPVITDTIIITAKTGTLPCKFLTNMCIFGKAVDDTSEKDLYRTDITATDTKKIGSFNITKPSVVTIGDKKVFELAFKNGNTDSSNLTQISARYIKLVSTTQLYKDTPTATPSASASASASASTTTTTTKANTNCNNTKPNYITVSISYKNDVLNNANLILPIDYKLIPINPGDGTTYNYYIFFPVPLIMNSITISYDVLQSSSNTVNNDFDSSVSVIGRIATAADLDDYNNYVDNTVNGDSASSQSRETMSSLDVCPSDISEIIKIQKTTQDICENIEYQDKIKAEKAKLEREKVYLVKLKTQFDEIKSLQDTINTLETRKQQRNENADSVRLLQYQQQKAQAAQLRDAAINRSSQYDKNQLYFDVNLEKTNA
jgi:hypothetical protein